MLPPGSGRGGARLLARLRVPLAGTVSPVQPVQPPVLATRLLLGGPHPLHEQRDEHHQRDQVAGAGFTDVAVRPVFAYWSSPAFLLTGRGRD